MDIFQIIAVSILGLGAFTALCFTIAFIVVSSKKENSVETYVMPVKEENEEINEIDLDAMLAKLEEASKQEVEEEKIEEAPIVEVQLEETKEEVEEAPVVEIIEEVEEENDEQVEVIEVKEEPKQEEVKQEEVKQEEKSGPEFDYRIRLEKIKESQAKIDRDLDKTTRAILKYERTIRRKERNQKMLDRRALELTNLNLLMYSVTDIKNVDAEKKARQEELTAHISELKASIQDAETYLETNKEKHENNLTLREYLTHEKTRYADEVKELESLIASGKYFDDNNGENN